MSIEAVSLSLVGNAALGAVANDMTAQRGVPFADVARAAATTDGSLSATIKGLSAQLSAALGSPSDKIGATRLETAMLDFAREAKALRIGVPRAAGPVIDGAFGAGVRKSMAMPDVGLSALDHATMIFAAAARTLAATPAAPLYDPAAR